MLVFDFIQIFCTFCETENRKFLNQKRQAEDECSSLKRELAGLKQNVKNFKLANVRKIDDGDERKMYYERILNQTRTQLDEELQKSALTRIELCKTREVADQNLDVIT